MSHYEPGVLRNFLNIVNEDAAELKANVVSLVKKTDDEPMLHRLLHTLKKAGISDNLRKALSTDADAKRYLDMVAEQIINIDATVEEKERFIANYTNKSYSFIDTDMVFDGKYHTSAEFITDNFARTVFHKLFTISPVGVGKGEIAMAVLSPEIKHSGTVGGGGDIQVKDVGAVEVKSRVSAGGRWGDARKAKYNIPGMRKAITKVMAETEVEGEPPYVLAKTVNINMWVNDILPRLKTLDKARIDKVVSIIADGTFAGTNNSKYKEALLSGNARHIVDVFLETAWNNYMSYAKFKGMLFMDGSGDNIVTQYFTSYEQIKGLVHIATPTIIGGSEGDMMPQASLLLHGGTGNAVQYDDAGEEMPRVQPKRKTVAEPKKSKTGILNTISDLLEPDKKKRV
jgi:hypothetical protein